MRPRFITKWLAAHWPTSRKQVVAASLEADFLKELGLPPTLLNGVILEAAELRPIVEAVRRKDGCSLLVFGCGHDSVFWERVNERGSTVFLEDSAHWADATQAQLARSKVYLVDYGTRLSQWQELLGKNDRLNLALPEDIRFKAWDVVLVDGPEGFADECPGRMKSIFCASRLVAPGGRIFVHDCERPAEDAYTSTYLTSKRLIFERRGRATLRGYAF